jgi:uncharacterized protein
MAIVADSGGIYGLYDARDSAHVRLRGAVERERSRIVIPSVALGEIDYLLRARLGNRALVQFFSDVEKGAFDIEPVTAEDLRRCRTLIIKYSNLDLGLCDSAVVAVAERLGVDVILTVDQRDFRAIRSSKGKAFRLLPSDRA